ncbi:MAG: Gfo/Idh/MocA family protein [Armatimonadota bacterium]
MPYRVAFIGTGGRSVAWARHYVNSDEIEIAALADPVAEHRSVMIERSEIDDEPAEYDDWRDMLAEHDDLDGVVISTPNYLHADQAVACLEHGLPVALEKPLATTKRDCERIIDAQGANDGRTLIGFVLRSSPFYSKIHELLSTGAIGQVVSIQADELPGLGVTSIMHRSPWRRFQELSGGAMLEKSCHDLDILNWMVGCRPVSLNCYGGRMIFGGNPSLPETCDECGVGDTCLYYKKPRFSEHEDEGEEILHQFIREDTRCIYNIDKDNADVQSVNIEYESGAVVNFMLTFNCMGPRSSRNFHAVGHRGRIWGNLHEAEVYHHDNFSGETVCYDASGDGSGHGGGDRIHAMQLHRMMDDPDYRPEADAAAGYLSAVMSFATDLSRQQGRRIDFHYEGEGKIELV